MSPPSHDEKLQAALVKHRQVLDEAVEVIAAEFGRLLDAGRLYEFLSCVPSTRLALLEARLFGVSGSVDATIHAAFLEWQQLKSTAGSAKIAPSTFSKCRALVGYLLLHGDVFRGMAVMQWIVEQEGVYSTVLPALIRLLVWHEEWEAVEKFLLLVDTIPPNPSKQTITSTTKRVLGLANTLHRSADRVATASTMLEEMRKLVGNKEPNFESYTQRAFLAVQLTKLPKLPNIAQSVRVVDRAWWDSSKNMEIALHDYTVILQSRLRGGAETSDGALRRPVALPNEDVDIMHAGVSATEYFRMFATDATEKWSLGQMRETEGDLALMYRFALRTVSRSRVLWCLNAFHQIYISAPAWAKRQDRPNAIPSAYLATNPICPDLDNKAGRRSMETRTEQAFNALAIQWGTFPSIEKAPRAYSTQKSAQRTPWPLSPFGIRPSAPLPFLDNHTGDGVGSGRSTCPCSACLAANDQRPELAFHMLIALFYCSGMSLRAAKRLQSSLEPLRASVARWQMQLNGRTEKPITEHVVWACLRHVASKKTERELNLALAQLGKKYADYAPISQRAACLALRHHLRPPSEDSASGGRGKTPKEKTTTIACLPPVRTRRVARQAAESQRQTPEMVAAITEAKADFSLFQHLLYRDWRHWSMGWLTAQATGEYAMWDRAFYLVEGSSCALRSYVRNAPNINAQMAYSSPEELRTVMMEIPSNVTVVQLALAGDDLWLVKLTANREPLAFPLAKNALASDALTAWHETVRVNELHGYTSSANMTPSEFWKERRQIDAKLKAALLRCQAEMFGDLAPLLMTSMPLTAIGRKSATRLMEASLTAGGQQLPMRLVDELYWFMYQLQTTPEFIRPLILAVCHTLGITGRDADAELAGITWEVTRIYNNRLVIRTLSLHSFLEDIRYAKEHEVKPQQQSGANDEKENVKPPPPLTGTPDCKSQEPTQTEELCAESKRKICSTPLFVSRDGSHTYCLVNPSGDLPETEKRMCKLVQQFNWKTIVGAWPPEKEMSEALRSKDVFLYCGHGSGRRHFKRSAIRSGRCHAAAFIMGCSSVRMSAEGSGLCGQGSPIDYAIARCPCLVGALFMVTDGEIDRYTSALTNYLFAKDRPKDLMCGPSIKAVLQHQQQQQQSSPSGGDPDETTTVWPESETRTLAEAIKFARSSVRLKYLTAGSVVVYGLPLVSRVVQSISPSSPARKQQHTID